MYYFICLLWFNFKYTLGERFFFGDVKGMVYPQRSGKSELHNHQVDRYEEWTKKAWSQFPTLFQLSGSALQAEKRKVLTPPTLGWKTEVVGTQKQFEKAFIQWHKIVALHVLHPVHVLPPGQGILRIQHTKG